ncbi:uncharacterized protein LOC143012422 [Genypterus blacodes]|uniref:uncharacterized protein LOC143012422 n=1 Tax=Genypterus blacodes TaxID=154954 RepID=UPI003F75CA0E
MQLRDEAERRAKPASLHLHHRLPDGFCPAADGRQGDIRRPCCCWNCASSSSDQCGPTERLKRDTCMGGHEDKDELQTDLGFLEPPLPLRSADEWPDFTPSVPLQHRIHNYGKLRPQRSIHDDSKPRGGVTVNMPQFSLPPSEGVSQISVMNLSSSGADVAASQAKTRTISLPDECRNIFITYSSDAAAEMVPFVEFLTKQGFRPAIDMFDNHIRHMDINKWMDIYLKDQSVLIIIAISPKYKADIEGCGEDRHGLHTKYFYSMMQNEFIQQGSLNFRFVPVLFLDTSQRHVPGWLQNTHVYRWPQDAEDLLLRLLREERYCSPPAPKELTLIITPVNPSDAAAL